MNHKTVTRAAAPVLGGLAALAVATSPAVAAAGNPHFIGSQTSGAVSNAGDYSVGFKEAGLASGSVEHIVASATAQTNWFCVNNAKTNPAASNKRSSTSTVAVSGDFTADKNGNVVGSLTIRGGSVVAPADFTCPSGQTLKLGSISYVGATINDWTSGASYALADGSSGCLLPNVKFNGASTCL